MSWKQITMFLCILLCCGLPDVARGQHEPDLERDARTLLELPIYQDGDYGESLEQLFTWLSSHQASPLAEAALVMLESLAEDADDPQALCARLLALKPEDPWTAPAARRLEMLQGRARLLSAPAASLVGDSYPQYLRYFAVLASWTMSRADAQWYAGRPGAYLQPKWLSCESTYEAAWRQLERDGWRREPSLAVVHADGEQGMLWWVVDFESELGGLAWIEIECLGTSSRVGTDFDGQLPGYALRINLGEARVRSQLDGEQAQLQHEATVLRRGRNRIELQAPIAGNLRPRFALRVLDSRGLPMRGISQNGPTEPSRCDLGTTVDAAPAQFSWPSSKEYLRAQAELGPNARALYGILLAREDLPVAGHAELVRALAESGGEGYIAVQAVMTSLASRHLPESWRQNFARKISEQVLAKEPLHHALGLLLASIEAAEDHEERAIERLERLLEVHPRSPQIPAALASIYERLGLAVRAEAALDEAVLRAPNKVRSLSAQAAHLQSVGQARAAAQLRERIAELSGGVPDLMLEAADAWATLGEVDHALAVLQRASQRDPGLYARQVALLIQARRFAEALSLWEQHEASHATDENVWRRRAAIAYGLGDVQGELQALRQALSIEPSRRSTRERWRELGQIDPAHSFLNDQRLDTQEILQGYVRENREDSLVALLDHSAIFVYEDGAVERLTQNLHQVRDLQACEQMKELDVAGELVAVASIDGQSLERSEPIVVEGKLVLPSLDPGDFVEVCSRTLEPGPADGILRLGGWFFASLEQTFERSRFAISYPDPELRPRDVPQLRKLSGNLQRVQCSEAREEDRRIEIYEASQMARVLPEPGLPPPQRFLPWVEYGVDDNLARVAEILEQEARWNAIVTPDVYALAQELIVGIAGQVDQARALHRYVNEIIDQRMWSPAAPAMTYLTRRGNPTFLYLALLQAAGISAELVWSRGITPHADLDQESFVSSSHWRRQPLILVLPKDGEAAWCEMHLAARHLPYGQLFGQVSHARAYATGRGQELLTPAIPIEAGPRIDFEATLRVDNQGGAYVLGAIRPRAGLGYFFKEQAQKLADNQVRANLRGLASQLLRGLTLKSYSLKGLKESGAALEITGDGEIKTFFDRENGGLVAPLPLTPLELAGQFVGQGERRLAFHFPSPLVTQALVRIELPQSLTLVDLPAPVELQCPGGYYRLILKQEDESSFSLERSVAIDVFDVTAAEFAAFREFCRKVDEAERARLHARPR